jgi:acetyl esterase/lipase
MNGMNPLRLAGAVLLFLPSLLTVLPPGLNVLWKLSIPVQEAGFLLTVPCVLLALWAARAWHKGLAARAAILLLLAAALLYAYPLVRALETARALEREFVRVYGDRPDSSFRRARPLVWADFLRGVRRTPGIARRTWVYAASGGTPGDTSGLRLDFYPAQTTRGDDGAPCVVVIHGGGWDTGNRRQLPELNSWLAAGGYAVAAIDYRLAPEHVFPAPVEDVAKALAWLKANAAELGIDPARFVLLGRSAGGQVAQQAAYTLRDPSIKAVAAFYAPADMIFGYSLPGNPLILDSRKVMDRYLGGRCGEEPELCRRASPLEFADANSPPTLLLHGRPDVIVSFGHTVHLQEKLTRLGVRHFTVDLPWATHGYDYVFSGIGSQISLFFLERFLAREVP